MKIDKGFTLIELVVVIIILGVLAAAAIPKFMNLSQDAKLSTMKGMQGALSAARDLTFLDIQLTPQNVSANGRRYTTEAGNRIRLRGGYPDGHWASTFIYLVELSDVVIATRNLCDKETVWCVRQKGSGWFNSRGYTSVTGGRGFVIYPQGTNLNQQACYVYYYTPNTINTSDPLIPIIGIDDSQC